MRLGDLDALDKTIYEQIPIKVFGTVKRMAAMREIIQNAPTVDAVPVVRCKDCKYAHLTYDGDCKYCQLDIDRDFTEETYRDGNWFCADGERRESDAD